MTPSAQSVFVYSQIFSAETEAKTEAGMQNKMNMHTDRNKIKKMHHANGNSCESNRGARL